MMKEKSSLINLRHIMKSNVLEAVCLTHIGKRLNHEDNFLFNGMYLTSEMQKQMSDTGSFFIHNDRTSKVSLFVISDGMGGHNAGEIASRICVEKIAEIENKLQYCSSIKEVVAQIQKCIEEINVIVCTMSHSDDKLKGMGATLVLIVIFENEYAILNIGDSRGYFFDGNIFTQITKDHTEGQRLLDLGLLTRKELDNFPAKRNLSRYIGYGDSSFVLQADEYYDHVGNGLVMICSDGISDFLSENQMIDIIQSEENIDSIGKKMMESAVAHKNADNATIILIRMRR